MQSPREEDPPETQPPKLINFGECFSRWVLFLWALHLETPQKGDLTGGEGGGPAIILYMHTDWRERHTWVSNFREIGKPSGECMHCNALQCTATHCSTLPHISKHYSRQVSGLCLCVAVCCSVFAVFWSVLQCVAVCCSVLQCGAMCCGELTTKIGQPSCERTTFALFWNLLAVCCSVFQCVEMCCSAMQCVAVCKYNCVSCVHTCVCT